MPNITTLPQEIIFMILSEVYKPSITNNTSPLITLHICRQLRKIGLANLKIGTRSVNGGYWVEKKIRHPEFVKALVLANPRLVSVVWDGVGEREGVEEEGGLIF